MTDPIKLLIDAGAIPASPFGPSSRYANVGIVRYHANAADPGVAMVRRRFAPRLRDMMTAHLHTLHSADRIDLLAARYFGDVELHWLIADANAAGDMLALTATPGARVRIPFLTGTGGA
jgi:hypothetical protein